MRRLATVAVALCLSGCGATATRPASETRVVAGASSVPGLHVALLGLSTTDNTATARFRVTNAGSSPLQSRVFGDPEVHGVDRQLGRDLGGAFLFDTRERALYAPLRTADSNHTVQGNRMPSELAPGQTVEVSVTFQRPPDDTVDVGFPTAIPFRQQSLR